MADKDTANAHPALLQLTSDRWCPPMECCDCPFGAPSPGKEPPNYADPGEGYYDCTLLNRKELWGEDPVCSLEDWKSRARAELQTLQLEP